jgi:hypothetical protein
MILAHALVICTDVVQFLDVAVGYVLMSFVPDEDSKWLGLDSSLRCSSKMYTGATLFKCSMHEWSYVPKSKDSDLQRWLRCTSLSPAIVTKEELVSAQKNGWDNCSQCMPCVYTHGGS